jgi:hypothetical protein
VALSLKLPVARDARSRISHADAGRAAAISVLPAFTAPQAAPTGMPASMTAVERRDRHFSSHTELRQIIGSQTRAETDRDPGPFFAAAYLQTAQPRLLARSRARDKS